MEQLRDTNNKTVVWIPQKIYALFIHQLTHSSDQNIVEEFNQKQSIKKKDHMLIDDAPGGFHIHLHWVKSIDLINNRVYNFHPFTRKIIQKMILMDSLPIEFKNQFYIEGEKQRSAGAPSKNYNGNNQSKNEQNNLSEKSIGIIP